MEHRTEPLPTRSLGALLDETFAIYGRHLRRLVWIAALVQAPATLLSAGVLEIWGSHLGTAIAIGLIWVLAFVIVGAAAISAVGQHYLTGNVDVRGCYTRAFWRARSLALVALIAATMVLLVPAMLWAVGVSGVAAYVILLLVPLTAMFLYWSMAIQVMIVEGHEALGALGRSFTLVKGSWRRVLGVWSIVVLVAFGLSIMITVPFLAVSIPLGPGHFAAAGVRFLNNVAVATGVPLVIFISGTLLYYDLRVRKEQYNVGALAREMGMFAV